MKKLIFILLILPAFVFAGNLEKILTSKLVNQHDIPAVMARCYDINEGDNAITCDLYDDKGIQIARKRVLWLDRLPFALNIGEKEFIAGMEPNNTWEVDTIKLWLDSKQQKDEFGDVAADDPYKYKVGSTKTELLKIVRPESAKE